MKKFIAPLIILTILAIYSCGDSTIDPTVETTVSVSPFTGSIDEGIAAGTFIGTVSGSTNQGSLRYSLSNMSPAGAIAIASSTGDITVSDALVFDFETNPQITATVTASNDGISEEADVTINLNDIDEGAPRVVWTGATVSFSKVAGADPTNEANQDRITENVWITRGNTGGQIYNAVTETAADKDESPVDTEWAIGTIGQIDDLEFKPFRETLSKPKTQVGTDVVVHLITDNIYLSLKITSWDEGRTNGGFAYERSSM